MERGGRWHITKGPFMHDGEDFVPEYERWRHGGWYVTNCVYPSGAVGCVSSNYPDKKWRVVCGPGHVTFPSRDAAARAEFFAIEMNRSNR